MKAPINLPARDERPLSNRYGRISDESFIDDNAVLMVMPLLRNRLGEAITRASGMLYTFNPYRFSLMTLEAQSALRKYILHPNMRLTQELLHFGERTVNCGRTVQFPVCISNETSGDRHQSSPNLSPMYSDMKFQYEMYHAVVSPESADGSDWINQPPTTFIRNLLSIRRSRWVLLMSLVRIIVLFLAS